ncbi:MAG: hypothetical protein EA425_00885 [Puniceicoccaceae bacterium]|nr:MAG: hypothetical protein EA425_00885 [Puniceicoccaceae bacterium]
MREEIHAIQARAMILWGEPRSRVSAYLAAHGFTHREARLLLRDAYREKARVLRLRAVRKYLIGLGLVSVPLLWFAFFGEPTGLNPRWSGLLIGSGLLGLWQLVDGTLLILIPSRFHGSVSELDN